MADHQNKIIECVCSVKLIVSGTEHEFRTKEEALFYIEANGLKSFDFECVSRLHLLPTLETSCLN